MESDRFTNALARLFDGRSCRDATWQVGDVNGAVAGTPLDDDTVFHCLIAAVAIENGARLIHCDADFEAVAARTKLQTLDWNEIR